MKRSSLSAIISLTIILLFLIIGSAFGEDAFFIDEDGKVGIGTNSPLSALHIYGSPPTVISQSSNTGASVTGGISIKDANGTAMAFAALDSTLNNDFTLRNTADAGGGIDFQTNGASDSYSRMYITATGNIGIGTRSPQENLHVYGTGGTKIEIENADTGVANLKLTNSEGSYAWYTSGGTFKVYDYTATAIRLFIGSTGNVGIGTTSPSYKLHVIGDSDFEGDLTADSYNDHTPYYEGDALTEIAKITGKDGEIDHSTLPDFAHKTAEVPTFEEVELSEISTEDAFETVEVEREKTQVGTKKESKGYKAIDGEIVQVIKEVPIYETETVQVTKLRKDVHLDEETGKVYQMQGDGEVFKKDGKIYQRYQTGTELEERRDIGAMVSILTVAVQQLNKENKELRQKISILESKSK